MCTFDCTVWRIDAFVLEPFYKVIFQVAFDNGLSLYTYLYV